jgi:Spy/CpxP family protein refolding chaperone
MRRIMVLVALVGFAVAVLGVQARAAQPGNENKRQEFMEHHPLAKWYMDNLEKLNLSPEQKQQIQGIFKTNRPAMEAAVKNLREKRHALHEAVTAQTPDDAAIRAAATALGTAIGDGAVLRAKIRQEVLAVLTPDQVKQLQANAAEMEKKFDGQFEQ